MNKPKKIKIKYDSNIGWNENFDENQELQLYDCELFNSYEDEFGSLINS